jgi:Ca-activated chloride channel family protein
LPELTSSVSKPRRWLKHTLRVLGVACLFSALARPQWGYHFESEKREGVDVLFAVDSSKSMLAQDLRPSRLVRAKLAVEELVDKLPGARLGLIAFAGDAFLQTPLTADRVAFQRSLDALDTTAIPIPGTNLQSAIRVANQAFQSEPAQRKIVVLVTDGEDLSESVEQAARGAADSGITVHALGVGTSAGAIIPLAEREGGDALLRDATGQLVHSRLDEAALRELSHATGGSYYQLGASGHGARELYRDTLSQLPKQLHDVSMRKVFHERFQWPLGLGMALLLLALLTGEHRARRSTRTASARELAAVSCVLLLALSAHASAQDRATVTTYNEASKRYRAGEFEAAAGAYRDALATPDAGLQQRAYYDLGNSLYRQGQASEPKAVAQAMERYKQAISAYESALALDADDEDARYNRDFVRSKLKELEQQQQQAGQTKADEKQGGNSGAAQPSADAVQAPAESEAQSGEQQPKNTGASGADSAQPQEAGETTPDQNQAAKPATAGQPQQERQPKDGAGDQHEDQTDQQAQGTSEIGSTATPTEAQPAAAAVVGGLTRDQAARLLDALESELRQLPSGYASVRDDTKQSEQARKDW